MELLGSFSHESGIHGATWGTLFGKIKSSPEKNACYCYWLTPNKKNSKNFTKHVLLDPIYAWEGAFPLLLPHSPPWCVEPKRFVCVVVLDCSLYLLWKQKMALQQTARQFKAHFHSSNEIFSHQWKSGKEDSTLALSENHNSLTSHRHSCSGDPSMFSAQFLSMLTFKNMNCFWCHLCLIFKKIFFFSN